MRSLGGGGFLVSLLKVSNKNIVLFLLGCFKFEKWVVLVAERAYLYFLKLLAQGKLSDSNSVIRHLRSSFLQLFLSTHEPSENHGADFVRVCFCVFGGEAELKTFTKALFRLSLKDYPGKQCL